MATIAQMMVQLGLETTAFKKGLGQSRDELGRFVKMVDQADRRAATMARATEFAETALTGLTAAAAGFVSTRLAVAIKGAISPALEFGRAMSQVATLADDQAGLERATDAVERLSAAFGHGPVEQARALYQILASGAASAGAATNVLTQANRLAEGSVTDLGDAASLITTILRSYGSDAGSAAQVSEQLFTAMKSGHVALDRLADGLDTVAPLASAAGLSLNDLLAGLATLHSSGVDTAHALDGMRELLRSIIRPTRDAEKAAAALGIQWNTAALRSKGLAGFLIDLQDRTQGSVDALGRLAGGGRDLAPFMALAAGKTSELVRVLDALEGSGGNLDTALAAILKEPGHQLDQIAGKIKNLELDLGRKLLAAVAPTISWINESFVKMAAVAEAVAKSIAILAAGFIAFKAIGIVVAIAKTTAALLALIPAINGVAGAMAILELAAEATWAAFGPIGIAVAAVSALALVIYRLNKQQTEAKDRATHWAAAMETLNDEQVRNIRTMLQQQIATAKLAEVQVAAAVRAAQAAADRAGGAQLGGGLPAAPVDLSKLAAATAQVRALQDLLDETNKNIAGREAQAAVQARIQAQVDAYRKAMLSSLGATDEAADAFDAWRQSIEGALDALAVLQDRQQQVGDAAAQLAAAYDAARTALDEVERRIAQQRVAGGVADPALFKLAADIRKRLADLADDTFAPLVDAAREAIQRADLVAQAGAASFVQGQALDAVRAQYRAVTDEIRRQGGALQAPIELLQTQRALLDQIHERSAHLFGDIDTDALDALADRLAKATLAMVEARLGLHDVRDALEGIAGVVDGILAIGDALGGIGDQARSAIAGVANLADAIQQIGAAKNQATGTFDALKALPGLLGAVAAGAQILGGLVGESASARAMREALSENSKRLRELRDGLDQLQQNAQNTLSAGRAAQSLALNPQLLQALRVANDPFGIAFTPDTADPIRVLDRYARQLGTSFTELQATAKALGITLVDAEGHIPLDALQQLATAAGLSAQALVHLSQTLDVQAQAAALRDQLTGNTSALAAAQRSMDQLQQFAPLIAKALGSVDLATTEGRAQLRAGILHLLDSIEAGRLKPNQLGQLQDVDQLLDVLSNLADALDDIPVKVTAFGDTLDAQRAALDLKAKLFGQDSPAAALERELDLLAQFAPQLGQAFQGLDATTAEGRSAIRTALQQLFTAIEQGLLSEDALGQLAELDDLLSIIGNVATDLDELGDATNAATAALRNVPEGFKLALRTFQSTFAQLAPPPVTTGGGIDLATPPPTATGPSSPPTFDPGRVPARFVFEPGSIVIEGSDKSAPELFDEVSAEARKRALALWGDSTRAAETL